MQVGEIFDTVVGFIALGALLGMLLLLPLYLSQRRDVKRLRSLIANEPDYASEDLAKSERRLDAAETELEEITGATAIAPPPAEGAGIPAATRVTHDRPALERITMERAALEPHPRWRRFVSRVTQPRALVAIGLVALLLGAGAIFVTQSLLSDDDAPQQQQGPGRVVPADVDVAVFNGTSINGLAGKVADDVEAAGYNVVVITNTAPGFAKTEVLYADGQKPAAQKVGVDLGVKKVNPLDRELREQSEGADVVVIAGEDRV
jgi:LytR cell envelope-related transcriptional attenuator